MTKAVETLRKLRVQIRAVGLSDEETLLWTSQQGKWDPINSQRSEQVEG